jgi:PIN domain nuclease of toxin-antitoxin system
VRLLLDSHIILDLLVPEQAAREQWSAATLFISVASLWELAIKVRQGKLTLPFDLPALDERLRRLGCTVLSVDAAHAVAEVTPWPLTKDPFDRLLLAVCSVEGLRLVTRDRLLVDHPLAWRPTSA